MLNRIEKSLKAYPFDRQYLNQTNNEARYLINGKGIVRRDGGALLFFTVEDDEVEFFHFGGTILDEYLTEITLMDPEEVQQLKVIQTIDKGLTEQFGLHAVSGVYTLKDGDPFLKDIIIIEPESAAFFQFDLLALDCITKATASKLKDFKACPLSRPHPITIAEDGDVIINA
ncbi:MAG: hypothetical protein ACERKO_13360 [Acetanaerobacterium sp.]